MSGNRPPPSNRTGKSIIPEKSIKFTQESLIDLAGGANPSRMKKERTRDDDTKAPKCNRPPPPPPPQSLKKGGKVKRTGHINAHKGEVVLPVSVVKKLAKLMK